MTSEKHDWLGLCLEMMSEYIPVEVRSKTEAERYWNINVHLLYVMELSELTRRHSENEELHKRNSLVNNMIRLFTAVNIGSHESDTEADDIFDNIALNNLLLLSILD